MTEQSKFVNNGLRYTFNWPEYQLTAQVSRIHPNHDRTTCKLLFTTDNQDANPHLLETVFNMTSSRSRTELAKDMDTRYKTKEVIDWKNLLEYLSVKSLREFEKGEPVIELSSADEVGELEYLIYPIAPLGKPTVLFGDPGSGKSQLATILAVVMLLPWYDNPLRLRAPKKTYKPLFLDYEADPDDIRRFLKKLDAGMNLGLASMFYRRCTLPLADDLEAIMAHAEEVKADCLIIDSMSLACGGDLNKMDIATSYFRALRQLNMTTISLAHTNKDRENQSKTILGSVLFEAGARSVWEVRGEEDDNSLNIGMLHRKNNLGPKSQPLGYKLSYSPDALTVGWYDPKSVPDFLERMGTKQRILELLKTAMTAEELAEATGLTVPVIKNTLRYMKGVSREGDRWSLTSREREYE